MATLILPASPCAHNAHQGSLLRMGAVVKRYGVCRQTILKLLHEGKIVAYRGDNAGWWLFDKESLDAYLGIEIKKGKEDSGKADTTNKKICVYARRSDAGKEGSTSLNAQVELLLDYVQKKYGAKKDDVIIIKEQASGVTLSFKTRKGLERLWKGAENKEFSIVVMKDSSRCCRVPGGVDLIRYYLENHGAKLEFAFEEDMNVDENEFKSDINLILDFLTVVVNSKSARKSAFLKRITIAPDDINTLLSWWNSSVSLKEIVIRCRHQNIMGTKHDGKRVPLTKNTIFRLLTKENKKKTLLANVAPTTNLGPLKEFAAKHLETNKGAFTDTLDIFNAFKGYCEEHNHIIPSSRTIVVRNLISLGYTKVRYKKKGLEFYSFKDVRLVGT
ncbi:MAG: recombinase family protein [Pirellulales bacterium]